jgi:aminoglycoside phosphotransferase (APT) family kinase protein
VSVTADDVADAFALTRPAAPLAFVQHTVSPTWRLTTSDGDYLVKELWPAEDPPWAAELGERAEFEQKAVSAGVATPRAIGPVHPAVGHVGRIHGHGAYRVYEWVDGTPADPSGVDLAPWLGATLAALHAISPYHRAVGPDWRWDDVASPEEWRSWSARADEQQKPWAAALAARLPAITELSDRLPRAWRRAADDVVSHRDFEPFNVLLTENGPMLIDWDSVGVCSATLEAGCVAVSFSADDPARCAAVLDSYLAHGGQLADIGDDLFMAPVARAMSSLAVKVQTSLGIRPRGRRTDSDLDQRIASKIDDVVALAERCTQLGAGR